MAGKYMYSAICNGCGVDTGDLNVNTETEAFAAIRMLGGTVEKHYGSDLYGNPLPSADYTTVYCPECASKAK